MKSMFTAFLVCLALTAGCASGTDASPPFPTRTATATGVGHRTSVPQAFRHACGHPHSHVEVHHLPVTIRRADCDLTGVLVVYQGTGVHVPAVNGNTTSISPGISVTVAPATGNVTITGPRRLGNA